MSSVPHDLVPVDRARPPVIGRGATTLQRHLGTIGIVLGFVVLSIFAAFAMSPGLMCRWTGYDCAPSPKAISRPAAGPSEPANNGLLKEGEARGRASASALAQAPRHAVEAPVPLAPADGHYLGRSQAACGARPASVMLDIKNREVAWRYEYRGIVYQWRGEVDAEGAIRASVGDSEVYKASGRFADSGREVTMIYPDCPDGIAMRIVNKIPD